MIKNLFDNSLSTHDGLDSTKFTIPSSMVWGGFSWALLSASLFSGSLDAGHYKAMVRNSDSSEARIYDDDHVTAQRERNAILDLKNNENGLVYGLVYLRI